LLVGAAEHGSAATASWTVAATRAPTSEAACNGPVVLNDARMRKLTVGHAGWGVHDPRCSSNFGFSAYLPWHGCCSSSGGAYNDRKHRRRRADQRARQRLVMQPFEGVFAPMVARLGREPRAGHRLGPRQDEASKQLADRYRQACQDYDASHLLLAALGRHRGPLD
jgi:hypothetical protein